MMKKIFLSSVLFLFTTSLFAQKITNIVFVGPNGITTDPKLATFFVIIKELQNLHFERSDYLKGAPIIKLRTYKDADLEILDGRFLEYDSYGNLSTSGQYMDNKKTDYWRTYNDTGKVLTCVKYLKDSLIEIVDLTVKNTEVQIPDEKEAEFPGGQKAWSKYLISKLMKDNPAEHSFKGGTVFIKFSLDTTGKVEEVTLERSAEFILDEKSLEIINTSPRWNPAFQNGKYVRSIRRQPITYVRDPNNE